MCQEGGLCRGLIGHQPGRHTMQVVEKIAEMLFLEHSIANDLRYTLF
jgi:hypothetical protein